MPDFRRGASAISDAQKKTKSSGGSIQTFTPEFFWKDGDEKFLLFLNSISDIPTAEIVSFIPVKAKKADGETYTRYERVIARTDRAIGDDSDPMVEQWDGKARDTCIAVAVELEPTYQEVKGRKRPNGFSVKVREFERRVRDEDGELTDQYVSVAAPEIAFICASPWNFFNVLTSYDETEAPIEETPVKVTRVGGDQNTIYRIDGYPELNEIDLSPLINNIDNVNYLYSEVQDIVNNIEGLSDLSAAQLIGSVMLDKRLNELADKDRYDRLFDGITESLDRFGGKKRNGGAPARVARPTQRRVEADEVAEEAPVRVARATPKSDVDEGVNDKIAEMRARLAQRKSTD